MTDIELNFGEPIPKVEAASYAAHCRGLEPFIINEGQPDQKTLLRWDFELDGVPDPDYPGTHVILDGVTSLATGERSKMRAWLIALTGSAPSDTLSLSTLRTAVVGAPCVVGTINKAGYSRIDTVSRAIRKPAAAPAPAPEAGSFDGAPAPAAAPDKVEDLDGLPF